MRYLLDTCTSARQSAVCVCVCVCGCVCVGGGCEGPQGEGVSQSGVKSLARTKWRALRSLCAQSAPPHRCKVILEAVHELLLGLAPGRGLEEGGDDLPEVLDDADVDTKGSDPLDHVVDLSVAAPGGEIPSNIERGR